MQAVKKLEIITNSLEMKEVCEVLEAHGVVAYTLIKDVVGKGDRGVQYGDELTDVFSNSYLLSTCAPEKAGEIVEAIRPILKRHGGVCLISDANWVMH